MKSNHFGFLGGLFSALVLGLPCLPLQAQDARSFTSDGDGKAVFCEDWDGAIADYDHAIALDPSEAHAFCNRGYAKSQKGDEDGAIADCSQAIALNPRYAEAFANRGLAKYKKGDFDGAIADFEEAIEIKPKYDYAFKNRALAIFHSKLQKGDFDGAIAVCDLEIASKHDDAQAYNNRGLAKAAKGDLDDSISDYDQAIQIAPRYADAYRNRAATKDKKGDHQGALADLNKAGTLKVALDHEQALIVEQNRANYLYAQKAQSSDGGATPDSPPKPQQERGVSLGTGFFVTPNGYILTDLHVVKDASNISVKTGGNVIQAQVVAQDAANDLAVLKVEGSFTCLPLGDSSTVSLGQGVFTVGFPDPDLQGLSPKLTKGEISSVAGMQDDPRMFQISVPVQPGSSGGSLVNESGNVIGLIEASLSTVATAKQTGELLQNVNYATKITYAKALLEMIPEAKSGLVPINTSTTAFTDEVKIVQGATVFVIAGASSNKLPAAHLYTDSNGNTYSVSDSDYKRLHPQREALDADNTKLNQLDAQFEAQARRIELDRQYLDNTNPQAVDAINAEVDRYNAFGDQIQQETNAFNDAVDKFNAELKRVGTLVK